jgi:hypothetical protein
MFFLTQYRHTSCVFKLLKDPASLIPHDIKEPLNESNNLQQKQYSILRWWIFKPSSFNLHCLEAGEAVVQAQTTFCLSSAGKRRFQLEISWGPSFTAAILNFSSITRGQLPGSAGH